MNVMTSLDLDVLPASVATVAGGEFALARAGRDRRLVVVADGRAPWLSEFEGHAASTSGEGQAVAAGRTIVVGPLSARNASALRARLPWLRPTLLGLRTSAGFGDRLGVATPGHIRALRAVSLVGASGGGPSSTIAPIFAQQSIREMTRTGRTPQQVVDDAMWAVFAEGWRAGFGADADHLKHPADIDACLSAGFTFFTIDPGEHVEAAAETLSPAELGAAFERLPWERLEDTASSLLRRYAGCPFDADGHRIELDTGTVRLAAVKYGRAVAHVVIMYRHLLARAGGAGRIELEVSLDETERPTSHAEHVFVASELKRLGVEWLSLAPRFVGRFEKGVDYVGEPAVFEADIAVHAAIARKLGPYKLSLHSGSDKFSIYAAAARETRGAVHLKTAGTSYLEALRTAAVAAPSLFREIYGFARDHYEKDRATYHVSARLERSPAKGELPDGGLPALLDDFHARQILHVTFGSVLTARDSAGRLLFAEPLMALLSAEEEAYAGNLVRHFRRHLEPFAGPR